MTTPIIAARFFGGNLEDGSELLKTSTYFGQRLSRSHFNLRLHAVTWVFESLFDWLSLVHKTAHNEPDDHAVFIIDSCPGAAYDNILIDRCRLNPKTATTDAFRGYTHSKRRFFYGLKLHAITKAEGAFVEVYFKSETTAIPSSCGSFTWNFSRKPRCMRIRHTGGYFTEDVLAEAANITLSPQREKNST